MPNQKPPLETSFKHWQDMNFVGRQLEAGFWETLGLDVEHGGKLSGWGFDDIAAKRLHASPLNIGKSVLSSGARTIMGPIFSAYIGYQENGISGVAQYLVGEYLQSTVFSYVSRAAIAQGGRAAGYSVGRAMLGTIAGGFAEGAFGPAVGATLGTPMGIGAGITAALAIGPGHLSTKAVKSLATNSYDILSAGYQFEQQRKRSLETAGSTAAFMTKAAGTMRQKAIMAINAHQLNARSALGQEAQLSHFNTMRKFR